MSELKKELDKNRKTEIRKKAKEQGLININIWVEKKDYNEVMVYSVPKDTFIESKPKGRKKQNDEEKRI